MTLKTAQATLDPTVEEIDPIRVAPLSAEMPVHQIAKRGAEEIRILKRERGGRIEAQWKVDYSPAVGRPGQLAYRLDTWVIKRRLSELRRPFPRLVRIGDLREIARELKHGGDTNAVRQAFEQNAATFIRAKVAYRTADHRTQTLEGYFNRYNVFFRGHQLPGGRRAETVYISLNDPYYGMVSSAVVRPLDFAYMRQLTPAAQRFYELLSPRLFAAIKYGHESAWIRYSDYCQYAVQKRQGSRRRMQIQMAAVQRMHLKFEYIESVEYENAPTDDGGPDWILRYRPGRRAQAEHRWFNEKRPAAPATLRQPTRSVLREDRTAPLVRNDVGEVRAPDNVAARALARRFAEQRRGATPAADPSSRQISWAKAILDALGGDREAAEVAIDLAAKEGRKNPKEFPAHLSGVLEGGYVERALQQRQQKQESADHRAEEARIRDRRERYEQSCRERAASRVAELDDASRRRIVDDRLPAYCHRYRYYLHVRPWSRNEVRSWAEPRILEEYGREAEPSYDEWCRQAPPLALQ